jgi:hypothetical protein
MNLVRNSLKDPLLNDYLCSWFVFIMSSRHSQQSVMVIFDNLHVKICQEFETNSVVGDIFASSAGERVDALFSQKIKRL